MMMNLRLVLAAVSLLAVVAAQIHAGAAESFVAKSATLTGAIRLPASMDRVFPLFGPVKEKVWAPGWEPRLVYPTDRDVAEGMVFTVQEHEGTAYWTVTQFDPQQHVIAYVNVIPGNMVNRIVIRCRAIAANETEATVQYSHTGLSETANRWIEQQTPERYDAKMRHWQEAITYGLEHGHPMAHH